MKKTAFAVIAVTVLHSAPTFADEPSNATHKEKKSHMAKVDTNKDGKISLPEFLTHSKHRFEKMDTDSNGYITKKEMKDARKKMKKRMHKRNEKSE